MTFLAAAKILSVIVGIVGTTFIIPIITALCYGEYNVILSFAIPMFVSWILALIFLIAGRKKTLTLTTRSSYVIVALGWIFASLFGAIPFYASSTVSSITDAVFESVSGFTTTGSSIFTDVENLPKSILLWRCQSLWLGGMGIVALTVALLPLLGVGGFQLIKAETTGPEKGKITPKITTTAKVLWFIYFGLTLTQVLCLLFAKVNFVDALSIAFATLGSGGFSNLNESIGGYNSSAVEWICIVFMFLSGVNFTMYFYLISKRFSDIRKNSELRAYLLIIIFSTLAICLFERSNFGGFFKSLKNSAFQVISIITTTGFSTSDYTLWSSASQTIIFLLFFIGGCSGSTAGGVKVIRWVILGKQFNNEARKLLHPRGVFSIQLDGHPGSKRVIFSVAAFFYLYLILVALTTFAGTIFGQLDLFTAFSAALSMVGNVGPAFGKLGPSCNYAFLPAILKWCYCFSMLAGRLELYTMVIFFLPSYWKK